MTTGGGEGTAMRAAGKPRHCAWVVNYNSDEFTGRIALRKLQILTLNEGNG